MSKKDQNKPAVRHNVTLSKAAKRLASTIVDPHARGDYIRARLDAENAAHYGRFTKASKNSSDTV